MTPSEFLALRVVQNGKLGVGKPRSLIKIAPHKTLRLSIPKFLVLGMVENGKIGVENLRTIFSEVSENSEFSTLLSQTGKFHLHTHRKNRRCQGLSGMDLQSRNAFDSSNRIVKIADRLGCLGYGFPTGGKNPSDWKIIKIPDS